MLHAASSAWHAFHLITAKLNQPQEYILYIDNSNLGLIFTHSTKHLLTFCVRPWEHQNEQSPSLQHSSG